MIKKAGLLAVLLFSLITFVCGCETTKGVAIGVGATTVGAAKDTYNVYSATKQVDGWMRKNLW
jgi:hypothetical protein